MIWTDEERAAWAPPEAVTVSEWSDRHRILAPGTSAEPGQWRTDRTPYLRAVLDALGDEHTQEIDIMKGPQVGGSEGLRCALGFWIDQDPGPTLIVFPSEEAAQENMRDRVVPLIRATPRLSRYLTGRGHDVKMDSVVLRSMTIYAGHSGSPQALATRPCRYVLLDEVDKYPAFVGRETDPITLAEMRTHTYGVRRKIARISTPTTAEGPIAVAWREAPYKYRFHLPCPKCNEYSWLSFDRFDWAQGERPVPDGDERFTLADALKGGREPVWYSCPTCSARWTERDRAVLLTKGVWLDDKKQPLDALTTSKAFHIPPSISPWVSWGTLAAEYIKSRGTPAGLMGFANQWEGLPFEERITRVAIEDLREKPVTGVRGEIPEWTRIVVATADAGGDHVWWTVRAWGSNYRSKLLDYGRAFNFDDLRAATLTRSWRFPGDKQAPLQTVILLIDSGGTRTLDSGSRTDQVYKFSLTDRRIAALKGDVKATTYEGKPVVSRRNSYTPPDGSAPYDVILHLVNVNYYKDVLAQRLRDKLPTGEPQWEELPGTDDDYYRQLSSEHRVVERVGKRLVPVWKPVSPGLPNHFWDCAVYQCAAADIVGIGAYAESPVTAEPRVQPSRRPVRQRQTEERPWIASQW